MTNEGNAQTETPEPAGEPQADASPFEAELAKARDELLRALAEVENTRRRADRQAADARTYAIDRFAADFCRWRILCRAPSSRAARRCGRRLPQSADRGGAHRARLARTFARHGLKRVGAKGEAFDPKFHQAVAHIPSDQPANSVAEVMQPGYVLGERTLRAAMVAVSSGRGETPSIDIKV